MNYKQTLWAGVCAFAASGLFAPELRANEDEVRLQPSSQWHMNFADDSCRLMRTFGEGDQKVAFYLERYEPGDSFSMLAAGKPLWGGSRRNYAFVRFGANRPETKRRFTPGSLADFKTALIFGPTRFDLSDDDKKSDSSSEGAPDVFGQEIRFEDEAAIEWISLRRRGKPAVILETGSLGDPMAVMRNCTDNLLTHWGIDLDKHRKIAKLPKPTGSPARWISYKDYPTDLLRKGYQGLVKFRLSVDENGKPTACHIQQSTRPQGFDDAVCQSMMRKAQFEPAITKDGEAIASYWRNSVRFAIPR